METQTRLNDSSDNFRSEEGNYYLSSQLSSQNQQHEVSNTEEKVESKNLIRMTKNNQNSQNNQQERVMNLPPHAKMSQHQLRVDNHSQEVRHNIIPLQQRLILPLNHEHGIPIQLNPPMQHQQLIILQPPNNLSPPHYPPHYPSSPRVITHTMVEKQQPQFKSLDNYRNVTQQSFAPSQKTIVLNHIANQLNGVYHSHVSTERPPLQQGRQPNTRHSHIHEKRVNSPARINFDYNQPRQQGVVARNTLFNSYIPTSNPIIVERAGGTSSSNAPHPSQINHQTGEQVIFWREQYEQLSRRVLAGKTKESRQQELQNSKFSVLEKNYTILQSSYDELVQEYHQRLDENQQYFSQIQQLQTQLNQLRVTQPRIQGDSEQLTKLLKERQLQIKRLTSLLENRGDQQNQWQGQFEQQQRRHQQEIAEMHEHLTMMKMQIQQRQAQNKQRPPMKNSLFMRSDNSHFDRSRMESFENARMIQLELQVGKLSGELNLKDRELKMANLSANELIQKLKNIVAEKDQLIRNLQQKVGLLQSDMNKKDSIVRNLRDQAFAAKLTPPPPAANVYSSAVNPVDHRVGDESQMIKRQLQNMRKNLFERERQKMILKQKYEQLQQRYNASEQALSRRKVQLQNLRRQVNDWDNLQHENDKLLQVLGKKNTQILQMKQMLMEKEEHVGQYENLSKENERLRSFMVKKNEELSQLADKLFSQQKIVRQLEASQEPKIHELEEILQQAKEMLSRKDIEIGKLNQSLQLIESNFSQVQFQLERHKNKAQQYQSFIKANMQKIQSYQQQLQCFGSIRQQMQEQINHLTRELEQYHHIINQKEQFQVKALQQIQQLQRQLQQRKKNLEDITLQQIDLREFKQKSVKQIQFFENKHVDLQQRCKQLQHYARQKQQRAARAQKQLEEGREQLKKHQHCSRQIDQLTEKISNYEMKIISLTINRSHYSLKDYPQPAQVFENKIVYQLKCQIQSMAQEISMLKANPSQPIPSRAQQPLTSPVKKRLNEFNSNLQMVVGEDTLRRARSVQAFSQLSPESNRQNQQIIRQNEEIQRLKQLARDMQRQQFATSRVSHRKQTTPEYIDQIYQQEITFYKNSNKELEQRVSQLLKVNKQLKSSLESAMILKDGAMKQYFEVQIKRLQKQIIDLKAQRTKSHELLKQYERKLDQMHKSPKSPSRQNRLIRQTNQPVEVIYNYTIPNKFNNLKF